RDEALSLPTEEAARLALRTKQVLAYESGVVDTVDPLGGSYFVEKLTDGIEERVMEYLEKIEKMGGALKAIELNFFQKEIAESSYRYQQAIEKKEKIIVGVNEFTDHAEEEVQLLEVDQNTRTKQVERLEATKRRRNTGMVLKTLGELEKQAKGSGNTVPHILAAVEQYATVGEISDVFRRSWGEHRNE
ncbi:MAG: methylmalonyl-CoA mutase family protein, partial [Bacteroidota bacterium]